jgi:hypothetical protein
MKELSIALSEDRTTYEPGEMLEGVASWNLKAAPKVAEVRLFWFTSGKGTRDAEVIDAVRFELPGSEDTQTFRFRLPGIPFSFSGKLITLTWAVELVIEPTRDAVLTEFEMAPGGREIRIDLPA